jgi:lipopolysaccharide export system protein LptA
MFRSIVGPEARLLGLVLAVGVAPAHALESDRQQEVKINADQFGGSIKDGTSLFQGNVRIQQGTLDIRAARGEFTQDGGEVSRALLTGSPATLVQAMDTGGMLKAQASTIDYKVAEEKVELRGNAVLERPQGILRSERVVYSVKTGEMEAGATGGGVQLTIPPKAPAAVKPEQ